MQFDPLSWGIGARSRRRCGVRRAAALSSWRSARTRAAQATQAAEADREAYRAEHRQTGKAKHDAPVIVQRLDDRRALAPLGRYRFQYMPPQKVTGDAESEPDEEGNAPRILAPRSTCSPQTQHRPQTQQNASRGPSCDQCAHQAADGPQVPARPRTPSSCYIRRRPKPCVIG